MSKEHTLEALFLSAKTPSKEELKRLGALGVLTWKGKKVVIDPFTEVKFFYEVCEGEVVGFWLIGDKKNSLSGEEGVFRGCVIRHQILYFLDVDKKWIEKVHQGPLHLQPQELELFLASCTREGVEWRWKNEPVKLRPDPLPRLVLTDRTGAFAKLQMDYGPFGVVDFNSSSHTKTKEEVFWEKDLLETDFKKQIVGSSHYYCPLDKVVSALSFLIDIGWTVLDVQGRRVVRQQGACLRAEEIGSEMIVRGSIQYGEHEKSVQDVLGVFVRREKFIDLTPNTVGLLDPPSSWQVFKEGAVIKEGISFRKNQVGLLEDVVRLPLNVSAAERKSILPASFFCGSLYPYQLQGLSFLSFLYRAGFHGLLADEMGLGKSVQLLAFLSTLLPLERSILIVMPNSLLFNWKQEIARFLPGVLVYLHQGLQRQKDLSQMAPSVILTSYALLREDRLIFSSILFECVILDEAQLIKNPESLTFKAASFLQAKFRLAMTGTPIENRWEDLWSLFHFLMPDLLGEKKAFVSQELVRKKISPFVLRRLKKEVLPDLPPKQEQIVWIDLEEEEREYYDHFLKTKRAALVEKVTKEGVQKSRFAILELILRLRQMTCSPALVDAKAPIFCSKFNQLFSDLEEALEGGRKILLYSQFTKMLKLIQSHVNLRGWQSAYLDGETKDREKAVEQFQNDPNVSLFLISLKAGGVGLNLTAADDVFLYDPWWNNAVENQAIDRAHRLGRKGSVFARRYIVRETIEEKILKLKEHKDQIATSFLSLDEEASSLSAEELYKLLF